MKRIDTSSLVDRVYEYLLDQIVTGAINYGDNISIKQIAAELNVSTMPVREAVKRLEFEQVVSIKPRSSCRVRKPSRKMIMEVYELREVLELYAVSKSLAGVNRRCWAGSARPWTACGRCGRTPMPPAGRRRPSRLITSSTPPCARWRETIS